MKTTDAQGTAYRLSAMIRVARAAAEEVESDNSGHLAADVAIQLEAMGELAGDLIDMIETDMMQRERREAETQAEAMA